MKFIPEDFDVEGEYDISPFRATELANAKLQEWLDKAPTAAKCVGLVSGWDAYELRENRVFNPRTYSHEAKLVCIKEVK